MEWANSNTLAFVLALLAGVAWLIRLESKASNTADDQRDLAEDVYKHHGDREVHHSKDDLDRRFEALKEGQDRIEKGVDTLNTRFDLFLQQK
jgi:hypothetical protein